jgi:hypothetical protein
MAELEELLKYFHLSEKVSSQQVSDIHIKEISQAYCGKWRQLPPYLGVKTIDAKDIDRGPGDEEEKRSNFLNKWKDVKGLNATYKVLIGALLDTRCRNDAEGVCKILQAASSSTAGASPSSTASKLEGGRARTTRGSYRHTCRPTQVLAAFLSCGKNKAWENLSHD